MAKIRAKKSLGQNFLVVDTVIQDIISGLQLSIDESVLEIGPGAGALTFELLKHKLVKFNCVELDRDLAARLANFMPQENIYCQDILKFDLSLLAQDNLRIVGNLPYYVATQIILYCLDNLQYIQDMNFMLQEEVVDRICAKPGSKAYGRLSVRVQIVCEAEKWLLVPATAFEPKPKVSSAMVRLTPVMNPPKVDLVSLDLVLRQAFAARRKQLGNSLSGLLDKEKLVDLGIDPQIRPDSVSVEQYILLANCLTDLKI